MSEHTPGPWKAKCHPDYPEDERVWGVTYQYDYGDSGSTSSVWLTHPTLSEPDARLVAASPALYEALKYLVNEIAVMGDVGWYNEEGGFVRKAQAALALVDGDV